MALNSPDFFLQDNACWPRGSTMKPQGQEWASQIAQPRRRPTSTRMALSSRWRPQALIGRVWSQSPLWGVAAANNLAPYDTAPYNDCTPRRRQSCRIFSYYYVVSVASVNQHSLLQAYVHRKYLNIWISVFEYAHFTTTNVFLFDWWVVLLYVGFGWYF